MPRTPTEPDDSSHVTALEKAGAKAYRGAARITGRGAVAVSHDGTTHELTATNIVVAVGSGSKIPPLEGIADVPIWTNREATLARELPASLLVLGGGPTGCELAQVFARFEVPTTIVQSGPRLAPTDHPRNSDAIKAALLRDGVTVRLGVRALRAHAFAGPGSASTSSTSTTGRPRRATSCSSRSDATSPSPSSGLEHYGLDPAAREPFPRDGRIRIDDGLFVAGDPAGPELHTHQAHYQGELAVRMALGETVKPDYRALPRATYTDPEAASVGLSAERGPRCGPRRVRAGRRLPEDRQGLLRRGRVRPRDDRRRPRARDS